MNTKASKTNEPKGESHMEGPIARAIEQQTAKLPSDTFLWLALGSIGTSLTLQILGKKETSNFIGQWAPTFLIFGLYNKFAKVLGSDKTSMEQRHENQKDRWPRSA